MKKAFTPLLLVLCLSLLAGCSDRSHTGSAQFAVALPQALAPSISRVTVTASASDFSSLSLDLASSNGAWGGTLGNIPVGTNRSFLAQAFDSSGTLRLQGQTSGVTIAANQTTAVALTLQELSPPPPYGNEAPLIDSLVASTSSVQTGGTVSLSATAHDPNAGDTLTFAWTASGGTFSAPSVASTSWTAPAATGIQTLTLTVTDSQGVAASVSLAINVVSGISTGSASFNVAVNFWPVVSKISASLSRLDAGQSTVVSTLASDSDGDALSYQWTASCPGTWTNATSSSASFVPSSVPASACNNCLLTVTVKDGRGGQTTGSLNLCVAASSIERFPPSFTNSSQSPAAPAPGQTVAFDVTALDPQSSTLTFAWTANTGTLGTPTHGANTSHITWTAPSCISAGMTPTLTATVTNAFALKATQSFAVTGLPVCGTSGWVSTGSMTSPRADHTATLLNNGKVLVSGGINENSAIATAEVYDPTSGSWSATGSMASPRYFPTATLLPNGKVLVSGGRNGGFLTTAEVYDPASGSWSATGSMASPRNTHTTTLLNNGKVLVSGGGNDSGGIATAEVYDPASGSWSATGSMASPRDAHTATLLPNGKVLVSGGTTVSNTFATAEVYDPAAGSWSATGSMASPRYFHTATLLPNGKVLVSGGVTDSGILATAEVYDPASGSWSTASSMFSLRCRHRATLLNNGKLLVSGGSSGSVTTSAELYTP